MAWPPKIATAKPHERPKPFDRWYFGARAKTVADMPLMTEILYRVCKGDGKLFEEVNVYLKDAFEAGVKHGKKK